MLPRGTAARHVAAHLCFILLFSTGGFSGQDGREVLIKFKKGASTSQVDSLRERLGLVKQKSISELDVSLFKVTSDLSVSEVLAACAAAPIVEYAEPNQTFSASSSSAGASVTAAAAAATPQQTARQPAEYKPGEVLVKFKSQVPQQQINSVLSQAGIQIVRQLASTEVYLCSVASARSVPEAVAQCNASNDVAYAEPNYIYHASVIPDDPRFSSLFGMVMIQAPEAWDQQTGSKSVIMGVIDTGVDTDHPDLKQNIWVNPGESGGGKENNQVDDDNNGFVDDVHGWDFVNNDNNPFDDNNHGTHVSGSAGAVGNNSEGVAGVSWQVSIVPLKFLDANGSGSTADAVEAIIYGTNLGAKILSNSWGGGGRSQTLEDAIRFANNNGVLFVAAAGNESANNDNAPSFPANYEVENVISVAANTRNDRLAGFSNFGATTVHLAAPGDQILSTVPRGRYESFSGTSMATPHVSGACALVWSQFPQASMQQIIIRLLGSVDRRSEYAGKVVTGGRLNVNRALSTDPIIARTTKITNTADTGPYLIETDVVDDSGIRAVTLNYQVLGAEVVEVMMSPAGDDHFSAEIPVQASGATVVYFVTAEDDAGNVTRDANVTFTITSDTGGGGCGSLTFLVAKDGSVGTAAIVGLVNIIFFILPVWVLRSRRSKRQH